MQRISCMTYCVPKHTVTCMPLDYWNFWLLDSCFFPTSNWCGLEGDYYVTRVHAVSTCSWSARCCMLFAWSTHLGSAWSTVSCKQLNHFHFSSHYSSYHQYSSVSSHKSTPIRSTSHEIRKLLNYYCRYCNIMWVTRREHTGLISCHFCWTLASMCFASPECVFLACHGIMTLEVLTYSPHIE